MRLTAYFLLLSILFASCERNPENGDENKKGTLTVYNTKFSLVGGNIYLIDQPGIFTDSIFEIEMYSSGIDLEAYEGTGHLVNIYFKSRTSDNVLDGTYDFAGSMTVEGSFDCQIYLDYNLETADYYSWYLPESGTLILTKTDSIYELTMNIKAEEYIPVLDSINLGVSIRCQYEGTLAEKDFLKK